jgi:hypothetical protein
MPVTLGVCPLAHSLNTALTLCTELAAVPVLQSTRGETGKEKSDRSGTYKMRRSADGCEETVGICSTEMGFVSDVV